MNIAFCESESQWQSQWELHLQEQNDGVCWLNKFDSVPQLKSDRRPWEIEQKRLWINPLLEKLSSDHPEKTVRSNISHSDKYIALAVSLTKSVGVDIEIQGKDWDKARCLKVGARYFDSTELETLESFSNENAVHGFFHLWTLKEATCKCMGEGIKNNLMSVIFRNTSIHTVPDWVLSEIPWIETSVQNFQFSYLFKDNLHVSVVTRS